MDRDVWVVGVLRPDSDILEIIWPAEALSEVLGFIQTHGHLYMERRCYEKASNGVHARTKPESETERMHATDAQEIGDPLPHA